MNEIWGSVLQCTNLRPAIDLDWILRRSYFYLDFQLLMNVTTVITKEMTPKTIAWRWRMFQVLVWIWYFLFETSTQSWSSPTQLLSRHDLWWTSSQGLFQPEKELKRCDCGQGESNRGCRKSYDERTIAGETTYTIDRFCALADNICTGNWASCGPIYVSYL